MPFVVTTKRPIAIDAPSITITLGEHSSTPRRYGVVSRVAVGTLEEAQQAIVRAVGCHPSLAGTAHAEGARIARESGGTVGPLPDGSLIEVEGVAGGWYYLAEAAGIANFHITAARAHDGDQYARGRILRAFNEANR